MLNDRLYQRLEAVFGEVLVTNPGQEMDRTYVRDQTIHGRRERSRQTKYRLMKNSPGEEYRVNCPFCNDTRARLYINHRWGVRDPKTQTLNLWLSQCWNEQCLSEYDNQKELHQRVMRGQALRLTRRPGRSSKPSTESQPISAPGPSWPLDDMLRHMPRHPAIQYLQDRFFDPAYLSRQFNVGFILESEYRLAINRLYAQIIQGGKLIGWQCRRINDEDDGTPKWWSCPGMRKGTFFYNWDAAIQYPTKVIVEGPPDVWGFGKQAMGLLGKSISQSQIELLSEVVRPGEVVAMMLDPDLPKNDRRKPHHIVVAAQRLKAHRRFRGHVVPIYLPDGRDPGDMDRLYMRQLIANEAARRGWETSFRKRA